MLRAPRAGHAARAAALAVAAALSGAARAEAGPPPGLEDALRREAAAGFAGAVLVTVGGRPLVDEAHGALRGRAVRRDDRFWIASAAKQFVAAAVLRCRELGRLGLDDALGDRLPGVPADKRAITVRQLLTHTSGLAQGYGAEGRPDRPTALAHALAEPLAGPPGERFRYSNTNFQLAVAVVELASGRDYQAFVREELWRAAGLRATGFAGDAGAARVAPARRATPSRLRRPSWGGEGVYSTTGDLAAWAQALAAGKVLSPASVELLFAPGPPLGEGRAALGWFAGRSPAGRTTVFTRGNEDFGANALLYLYPEARTAVVVLTHAGDAPDGRSWSRRVLATIERVLRL